MNRSIICKMLFLFFMGSGVRDCLGVKGLDGKNLKRYVPNKNFFWIPVDKKNSDAVLAQWNQDRTDVRYVHPDAHDKALPQGLFVWHSHQARVYSERS